MPSGGELVLVQGMGVKKTWLLENQLRRQSYLQLHRVQNQPKIVGKVTKPVKDVARPSVEASASDFFGKPSCKKRLSSKIFQFFLYRLVRTNEHFLSGPKKFLRLNQKHECLFTFLFQKYETILAKKLGKIWN